DAAGDAAAPPNDIAQQGFDAIGASILSLPPQPVEVYDTSAAAIADAVVADPSKLAELAPCVEDASPAPACYDEVATELGRLLFRRPLEQAEIDDFAEVGTFAETWHLDNDVSGEPFASGLKYQLTAMLEAPSFLYVPEIGGDPVKGLRALNAYELATRLSLFLLGHTPDADLLDQAEAGDLDDDTKLRAIAEDLLSTADAKVNVETFYDELFRLRFLSETPKNGDDFPTWSPELAEAMRQETLLLIDDVVWKRDADIRSLYDANYTFVNDALAEHYDMPSPNSPVQPKKATWPADQNRAGFLSQGAFLAHQSGPLRNSPTKRGKFVLQFLLCQEVPPPPSDVVPELPEPPAGGATLQELLEMHMEDPACNSCHGRTDPVGFAFEFFDTIGRHRTMDEGRAVKGDGALDDIGEWQNAAELGALLAESDEAAHCVIKNLIRGKLGHTETEGELVVVDDIGAALTEGYSLQKMLVEVVASPLFRYVGEPR
ncbi:MAG: DUF1592 domain-containing protein, partial [Myxococcales bacterium]|nr:DUF1592 domain-containing protein [Myxococcales bacterium]